MDIIAHLHYLLHHYGSVALFAMLALGIVGLPIPDETLLLAAGFLAAKGHLSLVPLIIAAIGGGCIGITLSYLFGRFIGYQTLLYFGKYIFITESKLQIAHQWFEKFGKYLLFFGYFIPGVRHLTGISAGVSQLEYRTFALFAYTGAVVWALTFLLIGYYFLHAWQHLPIL